MKQFSLWSAIPHAFFSKRLYRDVAQRWKGLGFLYLFILLALCWLPIMYLFYQNVSHFVDNSLSIMVAKAPHIKIRDGVMSMDHDSPYVIKDPESGQPFVVFDTSGQYKTLEQTKAHVLVTARRVFMRGEQGGVKVYRFSKLHEDFDVGPEVLQKLIDEFRVWWIVIIYPLYLLVSFLYRIAQVLVYGLFGLIIARSRQVDLPYPTLVRLSAIATTPAIVLSTFFDIAGVQVSWILVVYFVMSMGYLHMAIDANAKPTLPSEPEEDTPVNE